MNEEEKWQKIWDNIVMGIFHVLCVIAFFAVVCEVPNGMNYLFKTTAFDGTEVICFFVCAAILAYGMQHYEKENSKKESQSRLKHLDELRGLDNIWKLKNYETEIITKIEITELFRARIIVNNEYSYSFPLELFKKISEPRELTKFDNYILKYFNEEIKGNVQSEKDRIYFSLRLEQTIKAYLTADQE